MNNLSIKPVPKNLQPEHFVFFNEANNLSLDCLDRYNARLYAQKKKIIIVVQLYLIT